MNRIARTLLLAAFAAACMFHSVTPGFAAPAKGGTWTEPGDKSLPKDFAVQGEYEAKGVGVQVIALDKGQFHAVVYPGGLPGAGWDGKSKSLMAGKLDGDRAVFTEAKGKRKYLAGPADQFSATRQFPPKGHHPYTGNVAAGVMTLQHMVPDGARHALKKVIRKSKTLGAKPPKGALVLFSGKKEDMKNFQGGRFDEKTGLLNTDGRDIKTAKKFSNYRIHVEFMLPYRPAARGQGRGNSGFYQVDQYEVQVLDSFGLEGLDNECGGVYKKAKSLVNMCYPPLTWQTYDVDFVNAVSKDGKKVKNAVMTVKLNGVVIHDKLEINGKTGGSRRDPEGTPGPLKFQGHGNPLQYRNIWIVEK